MQIKFEGVKGYATEANAAKRGREVEAKLSASERDDVRWFVLAKEDGRFVPCFIVNDRCTINAGWFVHQLNVCIVN